ASSHSQRNQPYAVAAVKITAHRARIAIQRQGNCTNFSSGRKRHKIAVTGSIIRIAAAPSAPVGTKNPQSRPEAPAKYLLHVTTTVAANQRISSTARFDAMRLKASWSASAVLAYRKFSPGVRPPASAPEMLTQRCSYNAGIR